MTNPDLAERCVAIADGHMANRKAALCAAVALGTTKTIPAARKALQEWHGPPAIVAGAVELLDQLAPAEQETAP
jgi:hypothetical protein